MRNRGHELAGAKLRRLQDGKRPSAMPTKEAKLKALVRGAKGKVRALWRTGLLPSTARGASTSSTVDTTLYKLRSMARLRVGARQRAGLTA